MHIFDGVLSPPVCAITGAISCAAVTFSLRRLKASYSDRMVPLTGMMAAIVFAGQMVNVPVFGTMASGHLMGGVLAAAIVGPHAGCLALALVLTVQCVVLRDGGLMSLGANVLHMGVVGSLGGYAVFSAVRRCFADDLRGVVVGAVLASWVSVMAAACLFCVEFQLSGHGRNYDLSAILTLMVSVHSAIGIGEALLTGAALAFIQQQRPDLIYHAQGHQTPAASVSRIVLAGVVCALAVAAFIAPFRSPRPDGLETVAKQTGFDRLESAANVLIPADSPVSTPFADRQKSGSWQRVAVGLAGAGGTAAVLVLAGLLGRSLRPDPLVAEADHD